MLNDSCSFTVTTFHLDEADQDNIINNCCVNRERPMMKTMMMMVLLTVPLLLIIMGTFLDDGPSSFDIPTVMAMSSVHNNNNHNHPATTTTTTTTKSLTSIFTTDSPPVSARTTKISSLSKRQSLPSSSSSSFSSSSSSSQVSWGGRRQWLTTTVTKAAVSFMGGGLVIMGGPSGGVLPAYAGGLLQFPIGPNTQPLKNKYHFMRAGPSELEIQGIYSTNPLFLTNRENAMDVPTGERLILQALAKIKKDTPDLSPTVAYHSLAANGMDTGDLIARQIKLGREKLLPEFTYLDQRGIGLWDSGDESIVRPAVWALDVTEGGPLGMGGKPPPNDDGTPNETLHDQFIRLRQFISLQECRTAGEIILVIFPDGTGPALLSCMIAGIPFSDVHTLEYEPGEIRLDITPESTMALYEKRKDDPNYLSIIEDGKIKLASLRQQKTTFVTLKDQIAEQERVDIDAEYELRKKRADEQKERERQQQQQLAAKKKRESQIQAERVAKTVKEQQQRREQQQQQQQQQQGMVRQQKWNNNDGAVVVVRTSDNNDSSSPKTSSSSSSSSSLTSVFATAGLGMVGLGFIAMGATSSDTKDRDTKDDQPLPVVDKTSLVNNVVVPNQNDTNNDDGDVTTTTTTTVTNSKESVQPVMSSSNNERTVVRTKQPGSLFDKPVPVRGSAVGPNSVNRLPITTGDSEDKGGSISKEQIKSNPVFDGEITVGNGLSTSDDDDDDDDTATDVVSISDGVIERQLNQLAEAEQAMKDALSEASAIKRITSSSLEEKDIKQHQGNRDQILEYLPEDNMFMDYMEDDDDGDNDWLRALVEIRDEALEDDEDDDVYDSTDMELELVINGSSNSDGTSDFKLEKNTTGWKN